MAKKKILWAGWAVLAGVYIWAGWAGWAGLADLAGWADWFGWLAGAIKH